MTLVQNQLHNNLVENLREVLETTTIHDAENGSNEDKGCIFNASQKGGGPKILNATENDLIKIIPYEANVTKVCTHCTQFSNILFICVSYIQIHVVINRETVAVFFSF